MSTACWHNKYNNLPGEREDLRRVIFLFFKQASIMESTQHLPHLVALQVRCEGQSTKINRPT